MGLVKTWNYLSEIGVKPNHGFTAAKRIRILNQFCILTIILSSSYIISLSIIKAPLLAILIEIMATISGLLTFFFVYKNRYNTAAMFLFITEPFGMMILNYAFGKTGAEYFFFSAFILSFYLFDNTWYSRFLGVYLFVLFVFAKHFEQTITPPQAFVDSLPIIYYFNIFLTFVVGYVFLRLFVIEHERHQRELDVKNNLLEKSAEQATKKSGEIKILLKELSHRTKNSLQIVSSLINIQINRLPDECAKKALLDGKNRITSIALIHKKLYLNDDTSTVSFKDYVDDLISYLIAVFDDESNPVEVIKDIDDFNIKIDNAITLGLIINELLTNSFKYGLNGTNPKQIIISIRCSSNNELYIKVTDSGTGIEKMFKEKDSETFGIRLILSLVKQMDGKVFNKANDGNSIHIRLKYNRQ